MFFSDNANRTIPNIADTATIADVPKLSMGERALTNAEAHKTRTANTKINAITPIIERSTMTIT